MNTPNLTPDNTSMPSVDEAPLGALALTADEIDAILVVSLLAAQSDGSKHARESAAIERIAAQLASPQAVPGVQLVQLTHAVAQGGVTLSDVLPALARTHAREWAWDMAVCVCHADGAQSAAEQAFLNELRVALGLDEWAADEVVQQADALVAAPLTIPLAVSVTPGQAPAPASPASVDVAALDAEILNAAIQNGALELLPETLSSLAIIPLQMKLVYRLGLAYGFQLDERYIKDFLATLGVGLTSQFLEQAGRQLLGGLLGRLGGGLVGGLGKQAVSSGMSFVSTYALGQVARRYYADGRTLSAEMLKESYAAMTREAQALYQQHLPAIQARARSMLG